jgi:hypothetical protein
VELVLSSLREGGLLRLVHPSLGRSATRYRQVLDERFGLDAKGLSVLAVLLLRGPQTIGELRARTERMADFNNIDEVESELRRLTEGSDPLVERQPRRPGQKEERWAQLLTGEQPESDVVPEPPAAATDPAVAPRSVSLGDMVASRGSAGDELPRPPACADHGKSPMATRPR